MASVVIIDYGSGNLRSVAKAFEAVASNVVVSDDSRMLENASHIVLPGVGAFGDCMAGLSALPGMLENLNEQVRVHRKYFLGICVGMQMLFENGYENGIHKGLGWLGGDVIPLPKSGIKIPHMGWNNLEIKKKSELLKKINNGDYANFVHIYYAKTNDNFVFPDLLGAAYESMSKNCADSAGKKGGDFCRQSRFVQLMRLIKYHDKNREI